MGPDIQRREVREMSGSNGHSDIKLVAQGPAAEQPDLDPSTLAYGQRLTWERQEWFLDAFSRFGTISKAVQAAGINIHSVHLSRAEGNYTTERRGVRVKVLWYVRA